MADENNENESFLTPSRRSYLYESSQKPGNNKRIILIVAGIIILVALVAVAVIATGGKGEGEKNITPTSSILATDTPKPTETATPTPTPGKGTPTPKLTITPTGAESTSMDKVTGLDRADLKIDVENGSGTVGAATKMASALKKLGYDVVSSGNADSFDYETTEIQVKSTKKSFLTLLKSDLSGDYTISSATATYSGTDADAVVIIGKK